MTERNERGSSVPVEGSQSMRLFFSWALVSVLLGYGVVQTVITAAKLFGN
ncbi:hypothetical protein [Actinoplanes sp. DH11]|nr:hypothetical protein [Actinoplanes sp. DH11]